ncbi:YibE/F family protein [Lacticaseibacillus hulanensis]|uniref:YibE/F family protein n=1 Tax=Lacticaseibacillus hulanensis TaxID=2493111 RepID=UPI000FD8B976|nr:YibE/F family protein [Lacticaseibacillus hulanensis]
MNSMLTLILALAVLMVLVGGHQGLRSFFGLMVNAIVLLVSVILMAGGFNPVIVGVIAAVVILAATIFLSSADVQVAGPAFVSALIVMFALVAVIIGVLTISHTAGFGAEDGEELEGMSTALGVSFPAIAMAAGLISTLGAVAEAAIAVAAGINELDVERDWQGILQMGREIIGTAINTLFFGFFGGFAGLFIWFAQLKYPLWMVLNDKIFVGELLDVLFSVIAVILTVPVTSWVVRQRTLGARKNIK